MTGTQKVIGSVALLIIIGMLAKTQSNKNKLARIVASNKKELEDKKPKDPEQKAEQTT